MDSYCGEVNIKQHYGDFDAKYQCVDGYRDYHSSYIYAPPDCIIVLLHLS